MEATTVQELFPWKHTSAQERIYLVEGMKAPLSVLLENHPGLVQKQELGQKPLVPDGAQTNKAPGVTFSSR